MFKIENSRKIFLETLKSEVGVQKMDAGKVVASVSNNKNLIALYEDMVAGERKVADMQIYAVREWPPDVEFFKTNDLQN